MRARPRRRWRRRSWTRPPTTTTRRSPLPARLRVFDDAAGKMNLALADVGGAMLVVSQFTLLGDCRRGRRPSFVAAAPPEKAEALYEVFVEAVRSQGLPVATGRFRQQMQ